MKFLFQPDDGFSVILTGTNKLGTKSLLVKNKKGVALDGNYDGKTGSNYHMPFFIIG